MNNVSYIYNAIVKGNYKIINGNLERIIRNGTNVYSILNNALIPAMIDIGNKFDNGELHLPDLLLSINAIRNSISIIKPLIKNEEIIYRGTILIFEFYGCSYNVVREVTAITAESRGFKIISNEIGIDCINIAELIRKYKPNLVAISGKIEEVSDYVLKNLRILENVGYKENQVFYVPGVPVNSYFCNRYGVAFFSNLTSAAAKNFINSFNERFGNRLKLLNDNSINSL